eukprot:6481253-Amphidinium_carterae.1
MEEVMESPHAFIPKFSYLQLTLHVLIVHLMLQLRAALGVRLVSLCSTSCLVAHLECQCPFRHSAMPCWGVHGGPWGSHLAEKARAQGKAVFGPLVRQAVADVDPFFSDQGRSQLKTWMQLQGLLGEVW